MDPKLKTVTQIPLSELWRSDGHAAGPRIRSLSQKEISEWLSRRQIEFVVADVGHPLRWIAPQSCYDFWKAEVKPHLAKPDSRIDLTTFPESYCYMASEWKSENPTISIVLLERYH